MADRDLEKLARPLPWWHPKAWYFACVRLALKTVGRLSRGIQLGHRYGFDSGVMLDHVYSNEAKGIGPVGRIIDRIYLNSAGWIGIFKRGKLVQRKLVASVHEMTSTDGSVRIADLACGGGQYVLDGLAEVRNIPTDAVLRDYRPENVERATANAAARAVPAVIEQGDAFSDADLQGLGIRDIIIVSGLHEIIADDEPVRRHFHQIAERLTTGGILILTIQPDHPQLELIARTLTSHTGRPWAMRLRSDELNIAWADEAGLTLIDCEMEETGIFGVMRFRKG